MPGGTVCCVPGCANNTASAQHVSWHCFPKDSVLRSVWVKRINRKGTTGRYSLWEPTSTSRICGIHFNEAERKKYEEKAPRFFPTRTLAKYVPGCPKASSTGKHCTLQPVLPQLQAHCLSDLDLGQTVTLPAAQRPVQPDCPLATDGAPGADDAVANDHQYSIMTSVDQALRERIRQVEELSSENESLRKDNDCLRKKNEALLKEVARLKNMYDEAEQVIDATVPPQIFTLTDVQQDSERLAFYTGFESLKKFLAFVKFVQKGYDSYKQRQASQGRPLNLSMEDQLLLVLSRLRVGLLEQDLAYRFGVHVSTVSRVWTFWVGFLADHLAQVSYWPSRQVVNE
ncbi:unnamed protein product [Ixodes pacificus]